MSYKPHTAQNGPKFDGIEELVWEYLNQPGYSVFNLRGKISKDMGDISQQTLAEKPIWHSKPGLDAFVAMSLNCKMSDFGNKKSESPLYSAIAREISSLRNAKILIDWKKPYSEQGTTGSLETR